MKGIGARRRESAQADFALLKAMEFHSQGSSMPGFAGTLVTRDALPPLIRFVAGEGTWSDEGHRGAPT